MSRKKAVVTKEQSYDIGNGVEVIVRYPEGKRPKMLHNDTQVIVGEAAEQFATAHVVRHGTGTIPPPMERPTEISPELKAQFDAIQKAGRAARDSAAAIAASGAGAEGALTEDDVKQFTSGLETAALMAIPS